MLRCAATTQQARPLTSHYGSHLPLHRQSQSVNSNNFTSIPRACIWSSRSLGSIEACRLPDCHKKESTRVREAGHEGDKCHPLVSVLPLAVFWETGEAPFCNGGRKLPPFCLAERHIHGVWKHASKVTGYSVMRGKSCFKVLLQELAVPSNLC